MSSAKSKAQKIIDENSVVVFSKSYCPYCRATKSLLSEKHAKFFLMELDQVGALNSLSMSKTTSHSDSRVLQQNDANMFSRFTDDGAALQDALEEITGQRSVPNIFIGQKHIGGNSELQAKKGDLDSMLQSVSAV